MANVDNRICSDPATGTLPTEGLSDLGKEQAKMAGIKLATDILSMYFPHETTHALVTSSISSSSTSSSIRPVTLLPGQHRALTVRILSSDFTRAKETAQIAQTIVYQAVSFAAACLAESKNSHGKTNSTHSKPSSTSISTTLIPPTVSTTSTTINSTTTPIPHLEGGIKIAGAGDFTTSGLDSTDNLFDIQVTPIELTPLLRERNFGIYEGTSTDNYHIVWQSDKNRETISNSSIESPPSVLNRTMELIERLRREGDARNGNLVSGGNAEGVGRDSLFVLASHGDCLQILQTACAGVGIDSWDHRSLVHLETAEVREVRWPSV
ncbi:hypothetical protein HDU76_011569 [Blyttiomyces sp. JEL0837]|nr:hypothetical protein HDU76_011569 [Blyttiomyces sp. JEL0837]